MCVLLNGVCSPEGVQRLFDLIRVKDECFRPVFYFALRDTLVASDLEQATRIAYGQTRHRVVTLAGQLIETSGMHAAIYSCSHTQSLTHTHAHNRVVQA